VTCNCSTALSGWVRLFIGCRSPDSRHAHPCCRLDLHTVRDHAQFVARDVSTIKFDPADSDATQLLKSLAVQFAFAGEHHGVATPLLPGQHDVCCAEAIAVDTLGECGPPADAGPADSVYALCSLLFPDAAPLFRFLGTYLPDAGLRKQLQVST
jgi:hypothetical protein